MLRLKISFVLLLSVLALGACGTESPVSGMPAGLDSLVSNTVFEPQVTFLKNGTLVMTWRERTESGSDIFAAARTSDGKFGLPVRVNDEAGTVESYAHDGMRASIAVGSGASIAIAWADARAQIRAAISSDGGLSFAPAVRLDQAGKPAYRAYPAISFDASGDLHAIWIDSRFAEPGAEEPADLYYAKLSDGSVAEKNLTENQTPSICGCCRTFISVENDFLTMTFRNTTADGFRDPATITGTSNGAFSEPQTASNPLWELRGCPMAGPIVAGQEVLWTDGSTGKMLAMVSSITAPMARRVFSDAEQGEWITRRPPRAITTVDGTNSLLLVPGSPTSRLIAKSGDNWKTVANDLPPWAMSGAHEDGKLYLVGVLEGEFQFETYLFP